MRSTDQRDPTPARCPRFLSVSVVTFLLAGLTVTGVLGCQPPAAAGEGDTEADEEIATPVVITTVRAGPIKSTIAAASTIEPERSVTVHAESTGRISMLPIEEGDAIERGQLIAKIKQEVQRSGLDRAASNLVKAKQDLEVVKKLHEAGAASSDELRNAEVAHDTAKIDVRDRRRDVSNTRITAPITGTITERFVSPGAYVTVGAQLATIIDFSSLVARIYVPERELDRIAVGQAAQVVGKAASDRRGEGSVLRIAPVVDATTGTVKVTIALPAPLAGGSHGFLPGMYAQVTLTTQRRERAVLLDKQALVYRNEAPFVFVLDGDRVTERALKIGLSDQDHVEILAGLELGDEVVRSGQAGLEAGGLVRRVDPTPTPTPTPDSGATAQVSERSDRADEAAGGA